MSLIYGPRTIAPFVYRNENFNIDALQRDTDRSGARILARIPANQAIPNNTDTQLILDTATINTDTTVFTQGAGGVLQSLIPGIFLVELQVAWAANGVGIREAWLGGLGAKSNTGPGDAGNYSATSCTTVQVLSAPGTIALHEVYQNSGGPLDALALAGDPDTYMCATLLKPL
jgi:hypothetical protein